MKMTPEEQLEQLKRVFKRAAPSLYAQWEAGELSPMLTPNVEEKFQVNTAAIEYLRTSIRGYLPFCPSSTAKEPGAMKYSEHLKALDTLRDSLNLPYYPAP